MDMIITVNRIRRAFAAFFSHRSSNVFVILIGLVAIFTFLSDMTFIKAANLTCIFQIAPELGIITVGMGLLLIVGEFDLSVGSIFALCALIGAWTFTIWGWNPWLSLLAALLFGASLGLINGIIVTKARISSFIVTLGTMWIFRGVLLLIAGGFPVYYHPETVSSAFVDIFTGNIGPIPVQIFWLVGVTTLIYVVLEHTRFGNWVFATGSNKEAARMMGIKTDRVKIICFVILGTLVALAGIMQSCRISGAYSGQGQTANLESIGAAVVGGCSIYGGIGSIPGAMFGAIIIRILSNGLLTIGVSTIYFNVGLGLILIIAVGINIWMRRRR